MTLFYPDVSNVNWTNTETLTDQGQQNLLSFLSKLASEGFAGCAHKMSQGSGFIDPYGALAQTWCAQNSLPFIGYHYLSTDDPAAQAQNFHAAGGGVNAMFDMEAGGGDLNNFWAVVNAFNTVGINVQLGYYPQWYWNGAGDLSALTSNGILLVASAYPDGAGAASTIYANSGGDTGEGFTPYGGATPSAWQFTDQATVAGFTVDVNAYPGTDINVLFGTAAAPAPPAPVIVPPPATPSVPVTPPPASTTGSVTPVSTPVAATPPPANPTVDQVLTYLIQELSASGDTPLTAATNTVPAPNLTLRGAVQAILWITNAAVDLQGTGDATGRPFPPTIPDTILGHILSMRAEGLITQAIVTDLAASLGRNVTTLRANAIASLSATPPATGTSS